MGRASSASSVAGTNAALRRWALLTLASPRWRWRRSLCDDCGAEGLSRLGLALQVEGQFRERRKFLHADALAWLPRRRSQALLSIRDQHLLGVKVVFYVPARQ